MNNQRENPISKWSIRFGKHKGQTFKYLIENEKKYCEWLVNNLEKNKLNEPIIKYLNSNL